MVEAFRGLIFGAFFSAEYECERETKLTDVVDAATQISVLGGVQRGISTVTHNKKQRRTQRHCQLLDCMTTKTVFILHSEKHSSRNRLEHLKDGTVHMCLTSVSG